MKLPKVKKKEILIFLAKSPDFLARRVLVSFLGLLLLALIAAAGIFYKYNFLAQKAVVAGPESSVQFNEKNYQKVLASWRAREQRFKSADSKNYPDLFR